VRPSSTPAARICDGIELLSRSVAGSGGQVTVQAVWGAEAQPSKDYTVFVHLLDGEGKVVAQEDTQPRGGAFPTSAWLADEAFSDRYVVKAPPGEYTLEMGLYDASTLQRLGKPVTEPVTIE
jgi:hypothetical protein